MALSFDYMLDNVLSSIDNGELRFHLSSLILGLKDVFNGPSEQRTRIDAAYYIRVLNEKIVEYPEYNNIITQVINWAERELDSFELDTDAYGQSFTAEQNTATRYTDLDVGETISGIEQETEQGISFQGQQEAKEIQSVDNMFPFPVSYDWRDYVRYTSSIYSAIGTLSTERANRARELINNAKEKACDLALQDGTLEKTDEKSIVELYSDLTYIYVSEIKEDTEPVYDETIPEENRTELMRAMELPDDPRWYRYQQYRQTALEISNLETVTEEEREWLIEQANLAEDRVKDMSVPQEVIDDLEEDIRNIIREEYSRIILRNQDEYIGDAETPAEARVALKNTVLENSSTKIARAIDSACDQAEDIWNSSDYSMLDRDGIEYAGVEINIADEMIGFIRFVLEEHANTWAEEEARRPFNTGYADYIPGAVSKEDAYILIDEMRESINDRVEYFRDNPESEVSIAAIRERFGLKNFFVEDGRSLWQRYKESYELFSIRGLIPAYTMGAVFIDWPLNCITRDANEMLDQIKRDVYDLVGVSEEQISEYIHEKMVDVDNFVTEQLIETYDRAVRFCGNDGIWMTYFAYINETQIINQIFYRTTFTAIGRIIQQALGVFRWATGGAGVYYAQRKAVEFAQHADDAIYVGDAIRAINSKYNEIVCISATPQATTYQIAGMTVDLSAHRCFPAGIPTNALGQAQPFDPVASAWLRQGVAEGWLPSYPQMYENWYVPTRINLRTMWTNQVGPKVVSSGFGGKFVGGIQVQPGHHIDYFAVEGEAFRQSLKTSDLVGTEFMDDLFGYSPVGTTLSTAEAYRNFNPFGAAGIVGFTVSLIDLISTEKQPEIMRAIESYTESNPQTIQEIETVVSEMLSNGATVEEIIEAVNDRFNETIISEVATSEEIQNVVNEFVSNEDNLYETGRTSIEEVVNQYLAEFDSAYSRGSDISYLTTIMQLTDDLIMQCVNDDEAATVNGAYDYMFEIISSIVGGG